MIVELINRVKEQYAKNLPFVIYRKPNEGVVNAVLQEEARLYHVKDFTETGFVFAPFDSNKSAILLAPDVQLKAEYIANIKTKRESFDNFKHELAQKEFHIQLVKSGIQEIQSGKLQKVVLSRKVGLECETSPIDIFQSLLDNYASAFCYLWYHPKIGVWLGATPEILLRLENNQFTTMSLAGTKKYEENNTPNWGNKEIEEQQLVTDYILKAINKTVLNIKVSERESVRAGSLWHLRTKITGRSNSRSLIDILKVLHPTPAVCGLPVEETKDFIALNEDYNREFYTGFLGELNIKEGRDRSQNRRNQENKAYRSVKTTSTLFVNLRCMQLKDKLATIYVGGGVTKDSDPEKEWLETVAKSKTMLQIIYDL